MVIQEGKQPVLERGERGEVVRRETFLSTIEK
jgi:hypothetical protein